MNSELPSTYSHNLRKARKAHTCCECHGQIRPGEHYHYHHGVWDGQGASFKICEDCNALRWEIDATITDPYEKLPFECLCEWVFESDRETIRRFIGIKDKRGAKVPDWMRERVAV